MTAAAPSRQTYGVSEMAQILGIREEVVRRHLRDGKMPGRRIGGIWLVHQKTFDQWVESWFGAPT